MSSVTGRIRQNVFDFIPRFDQRGFSTEVFSWIFHSKVVSIVVHSTCLTSHRIRIFSLFVIVAAEITANFLVVDFLFVQQLISFPISL